MYQVPGIHTSKLITSFILSCTCISFTWLVVFIIIRKTCALFHFFLEWYHQLTLSLSEPCQYSIFECSNTVVGRVTGGRCRYLNRHSYVVPSEKKSGLEAKLKALAKRVNEQNFPAYSKRSVDQKYVINQV